MLKEACDDLFNISSELLIEKMIENTKVVANTFNVTIHNTNTSK